MFTRHASAFAPTAAFVLLWSSGAIVSEIGLRHGSPFALLILRYAIALGVLATFAIANRRLLPERGSRRRVAFVGFAIAGLYSICYLLALDHGVTPGALATMLGVQPILTVFLTERRVTARRLGGLLCALGGLALVVWDGLAAARFTVPGVGFTCLSLLGITLGAIAQKRETQAPLAVLPMQYAVGLLLICAVAPMAPFKASWDPTFLVAVLWLGLVISVGTTFLLYRLISRGNLVNVTSLLYLVPGVTAAMDWLLLGNPMPGAALLGLGAIVAGLVLVFRERGA